MKQFLLTILLFCTVQVCFSQKNQVSYEDLDYILHNNINKADTFFMAKGYTLVKKDEKKNTRKYSLNTAGNYSNLNLRTDGKRLYVEIETNDIEQYNLIYNSIAQYVNKESSTNDMQAFNVKGLGNIYIMVSDTIPYNPLKRNFDIHIVSDKSITAYN
jgi:predicted house-cleaning NTP pyrophosphatase (Maf/HAM1 superfamily)